MNLIQFLNNLQPHPSTTTVPFSSTPQPPSNINYSDASNISIPLQSHSVPPSLTTNVPSNLYSRATSNIDTSLPLQHAHNLMTLNSMHSPPGYHNQAQNPMQSVILIPVQHFNRQGTASGLQLGTGSGTGYDPNAMKMGAINGVNVNPQTATVSAASGTVYNQPVRVNGLGLGAPNSDGNVNGKGFLNPNPLLHGMNGVPSNVHVTDAITNTFTKSNTSPPLHTPDSSKLQSGINTNCNTMPPLLGMNTINSNHNDNSKSNIHFNTSSNSNANIHTLSNMNAIQNPVPINMQSALQSMLQNMNSNNLSNSNSNAKLVNPFASTMDLDLRRQSTNSGITGIPRSLSSGSASSSHSSSTVHSSQFLPVSAHQCIDKLHAAQHATDTNHKGMLRSVSSTPSANTPQSPSPEHSHYASGQNPKNQTKSNRDREFKFRLKREVDLNRDRDGDHQEIQNQDHEMSISADSNSNSNSNSNSAPPPLPPHPIKMESTLSSMPPLDKGGSSNCNDHEQDNDKESGNRSECPNANANGRCHDHDNHCNIIGGTEGKSNSSKELKSCYCPDCGKHFKSEFLLVGHQKSVHRDGSKPTFPSCPYCGKEFTHHGNRRTHIRTHTNERPFKCTQCSKAFKQKHSLNDHMRIHTGERPFKCNVCFKAFSIKHNMEIHRKIHSEQRPHVCTICNTSYRSRSGKNSHMKSRHPIIWQTMNPMVRNTDNNNRR